MGLPPLPEPGFLKLSELACRWKCSEEQLISYFKDGLLEIGVGCDERYVFVRNHHKHDGLMQGCHAHLNGVYLIIPKLLIGTWRYINPAKKRKDYYPEHTLINRATAPDGKQLILSGFAITSDDFAVSMEEIKRFEKEHDLNVRLEDNIKGDDCLGINTGNFQIKEPTRKNDWFDCIRDHALDFFNKHNKHPLESQLWSMMYSSSLPEWSLLINEKNSQILLGGKALDRETFKKRYRDYFPADKVD